MSESTNSKSLPLATPERNPSISRELHQSRPLSMAMPLPSSPLALALPAQVRRSNMADNNVQLSDGTSSELQAVRRSSQSPFQLPYGWVVEERPRPSKPSHIDRYYYEPLTRRQFRSLLSVKRHLAGQSSGSRVNMKTVPLNEGTYIEAESGLRFDSVEAVESFLSEPSLGYAPPEGRKPNRPLVLESGIRDQLTEAEGSVQRPFLRRHSVVLEGKTVLEASTLLGQQRIYRSMLSEEPEDDEDDENETESEEDYIAPVRSLPTPTPERVKWVLSDPGGSWNPFVDGAEVPESEKMKWAEAFVHSVRDDDVPKN